MEKFTFDGKGAKKSTQPAIVYRTRAKPSDSWTNLSNDSTFPITDPVLTKEVYEDNFSTKKLSGICSSNKPCMKTEDLPEEYNGATNRSSSIILPSNVPKIFQGTEASFVVIESPFFTSSAATSSEPGTNIVSGCGSTEAGHLGGNNSRKFPGQSYFRSGYRNVHPTGYVYHKTTCQNGTQARGSSACRDNWSAQAWPADPYTRPDLHAIAHCDFSDNWYAEFWEKNERKGFQFWTGFGNNLNLQKAVVFVVGQTKIDTDDLYSDSNTTGFRARIIPWVSGTHDTRLKRRWLLSPNGKLATYYATPNWYYIGNSKYGNYMDFEASTPTSLSI
jgi:hypothetical protein